DIGLIGLAVMGQNLVLNMNDHGFTVAVHNRTVSRVDEFVAGEARGTRVIGARSIPELVSALKRPRRVMLLVKAGPPVDALIAQVAPRLGEGLGLTPAEAGQVFAEWNRGPLESYLVEIAGAILGHRDDDGAPLVEKILDAAGQKGTGKWSVTSALDLGMPVTLIAEAVFARCLSALKAERVAAAEVLDGPSPKIGGERAALVEDVRRALYASKIISYAQGYMLLREAAREHAWRLNYGGIALMWRGGCIIRSRFLGKIREAFDREPGLRSLLVDPFFRDAVRECQPAWRRVVSQAALAGI